MEQKARDEKEQLEQKEKQFFEELFKKSEQSQDEQLYKKKLYVLAEELESSKEKNDLQFYHDTILNKLMLEDYSEFPPKNEHVHKKSDEKATRKDEDNQEKLIEEENEFLRRLHLINYLTESLEI